MFKKDHSGVRSLKFVIFGPAGAGKTTLLKLYSFIQNHNKDGYEEEIISINNPLEETALFDQNVFSIDTTTKAPLLNYRMFAVAGQPRYKEIRSIILNGADGIILVLDFQKQNINLINPILDEIKSFQEKEYVPVIVLLNKTDLEFNQKVEMQELSELLQDSDINYLEPLYPISCIDAKDDMVEMVKIEKSMNFKKLQSVQAILKPIMVLTNRVINQKTLKF